MSNPLPRFGALRSAALAILGLAALAAACDTRLPTTAEVASMDVRSAERRAMPLMSGDARYTIDGRAATAEEARALPADQIATINVMKTGDGRGEVSIVTAAYARANGIRVAAPAGDVLGLRATEPGESRQRVEISTFEGLILIDGRVASSAQAQALDPSRIVSVEVTKGPTAAEQHDDPRARNGVIRITTRAAQR